METTQTSTVASIESRSGWRKTDTMWMLGLYGTAIGAGVLFLPINAGVGGLIPLIIMAIIAFPMTYFAHRGLTRFVLSGKNPGEDITEVVEEHFGVGAGKLITLLYFFAIYPILLVYSVAITNTVESFMLHQLHMTPPPRAILSLILIVGMMTIVRFGEQMIVKAMSILVFPFVAALMVLACYLIPQWNGAALETLSLSSASATGNGLLMTLWLAIPVMVFSFSHAPIISSFSAAQKKRCQASADQRAKRIIKCSSLLICGSVLFFVVSCVMSLSQAEMALARTDNISVLSALANKFSNPLIAYVGPLIAILAMSKSFLGTSMGVSEGTVSMVNGACQGLGLSLREATIARVSSVILFVVTGVITYLNPNVLEIIEKVSGPLIAVILFLLPACSIYRLPALKRYRGASTLFVLVIGLLAISALIYDLL